MHLLLQCITTVDRVKCTTYMPVRATKSRYEVGSPTLENRGCSIDILYKRTVWVMFQINGRTDISPKRGDDQTVGFRIDKSQAVVDGFSRCYI